MLSRAMSLRVLVVPDKFKGTLTAREAAAAIVEGWRSERAGDVLETLPMSDGGDGFGDVIGALLAAEPRACATVDAAGQPRNAEWWLDVGERAAVVEAAQVNGLALLPRAAYHPFELDSFGLGAVLSEAQLAKAAHVYVGLGGSATNDGGFGLARSLGWRFFDERDRELRSWTELESLTRVSAPESRLAFERITVAVDVQNPLLGANGATRVYGPQKGLAPDELPRAEACLARLAKIVAPELAFAPGAGAAGGLGFGLLAFCQAALEPGVAFFARLSGLELRIAAADIILTGEGRLDRSSFMGKGVGAVAAWAARAGKPCWCLAGSVDPAHEADAPPSFRSFSSASGLGAERSQATAYERLRALAALAAARAGAVTAAQLP
ncbi:MAG: glycerate kinase [Myxococcota bacterium]|nr:glycerate kinase [Myxococcota bacterium]